MTMDDKKNCDLCGLEILTDDFQLKAKEGDKQFCCEGCKGIYQMLNEDQIQHESVPTDHNH